MFYGSSVAVSRGVRTKTGFDLTPADRAWCRNNTRFKETNIVKLHKRFKARCTDLDMNKEQFADMFNPCYPFGNMDSLAEEIFDNLDPEGEEKLDLKVEIIGMYSYIVLV